MEVKINREIREYTEGIFFGLTLRQCACAGLACAAAVLVFLLVKPRLGLETASWVCMLAAFPFVMVGFVKYNGMTAEKFAAEFGFEICNRAVAEKALARKSAGKK